NGKVDRKALPRPEGHINTREEYEAPRNETEKKLAELWQDILKVEKIGINDNFFQLGGHSLKVSLLALKVKKVLKVDLPLREVFKTPTIKALADYLNKDIPLKYDLTDESVVLIKKGSISAENLFLIHDVSGDILAYSHLCNNLTSDFNYWGIRAKNIKGLAPENLRIEEIASCYMEKIKNIQPNGSYHLGGWSTGGSIAFELATQLEKNGEEVEKLWLFDADAPGDSKQGIQNWNKFKGFTVESEKDFINKLAIETKIRDKIQSLDEIEAIWYKITKYLEEHKYNVDEVANFMNSYIPFASEYSDGEYINIINKVNLIRSLDRATVLYMPVDMIKAEVVYFRAKDSHINDVGKWLKYCKNLKSIVDIEGNHFSIFQQPDISMFSKEFDKRLNGI
ncbi:thioesterase domain-containing protein, partial [Aminipila sp.]|uniref:thioesterase domain-containing protein n=1 Tax=Aminipila sp. TaxID=2060095 RepID=UPI00289F9747